MVSILLNNVMITKYGDFFRKFQETETFIVGHEYEYTWLINKTTGKEIYLGDFYGDPSFGLISVDNNWCLTGGESLSLWKPGSEVLQINNDNLKWVCKARQTRPFKAQLLIDPYSEAAAIWSLNIQTLESYKVKIFEIHDDFNINDFNW